MKKTVILHFFVGMNLLYGAECIDTLINASEAVAGMNKYQDFRTIQNRYEIIFLEELQTARKSCDDYLNDKTVKELMETYDSLEDRVLTLKKLRNR